MRLRDESVFHYVSQRGVNLVVVYQCVRQRVGEKWIRLWLRTVRLCNVNAGPTGNFTECNVSGRNRAARAVSIKDN